VPGSVARRQTALAVSLEQ